MRGEQQLAHENTINSSAAFSEANGDVNENNPNRENKVMLFEEVDSSRPNLLELYFGDLGEHIISFSSAAELCKLDILNRQFRGLTAKTWSKQAYERFGLKNGKDGYRMGTSLLREPIFIHINTHPTYGNMHYGDVPNVTTNNELVVVDTPYLSVDGVPDGIGLYNASDLTYLGPQRGGAWKTTVAGPSGNHTFVSCDGNTLYFRRGDVTHHEDFPNIFSLDGIPHIAAETHVIAVIGSTVYLYRIVSDDRLVEMCQTNRLGREVQGDDEYYETEIAWGADESEFVIYNSIKDSDYEFKGKPPPSTITIWSFNAEEDSMTPTKTIHAKILLMDIELSEDFILGSCESKKIHIWDRHTGFKKEESLCDAEEGDQLSRDRLIFPLRMSCHGHMLVTTSHIGVALCIWNIRTGKLLRRHDQQFTYDIPGAYNATETCSMAYSKPLNAYICVDGYLNVWTFPTNQQQKDAAMMIRDREFYTPRRHHPE